MLIEDAIASLQVHEVPYRAAKMRLYHKVERAYWGISNPAIDDQARIWRQELNLDERLKLAADLWNTNAHEGRLCAAKLLTQARIRPDDTPAWDLLKSWVPDFDSWAIADLVCMAGHRRLSQIPERVGEIAEWTQSPHMWTRRAAMVITLPWTKQRVPKPEEVAVREMILRWAAAYAKDQTWLIQKSVSWWLRELSRKDPERVQRFLSEHGSKMRISARKDAARLITSLITDDAANLKPEIDFKTQNKM